MAVLSVLPDGRASGREGIIAESDCEDERQVVRQSHNNIQVQELYKKFLGEPNSHLAHELLHSWISLYGIKLPNNEAEGLCNLGKFLVLKQEKNKDAAYLIHWALEENKDPVYGDGYRLMKKRLEKLGWKGLMDALLWENKTPEPVDL